MTDKTQAVSVKILEKEYKVACPKGEHFALIDAAKEVDKRMRIIKKGGKVLNSDRIGVMVALNLAHELLDARTQVDNIDETILDRIDQLQNKITSTLNHCEQYEKETS